MFGQKYPQILELNRNLHWHLFYASNCYRIKLMRQIIIMKHINLNSFSEILINYNESFIRKKFSTLFNWIISIWIHTRNKYFIGAMSSVFKEQKEILYDTYSIPNSPMISATSLNGYKNVTEYQITSVKVCRFQSTIQMPYVSFGYKYNILDVYQREYWADVAREKLEYTI